MNRKYISTIAISLTIMSMALVGCNSSDEDISKVLKATTVTKNNEESNKKEVKNNLSLEQLDKLKSDDMLQEGINKEKLKECMDDFADSIYNISNEAKAKAGVIKDQVNNMSYSMKKLNNRKNKAENSLSSVLDSIQSDGVLGKITGVSENGKKVKNNINYASDKIQLLGSNIDDFKNNAGNVLAEGKQNINGLVPMVRADVQRNINSVRGDVRQGIQSSIKDIKKDLREDAQHDFNIIKGDVKNYIQANSNGIKKDFKEELDKNIQGIRNDIRQDVQKNINDIGTDVKARMKDNQDKISSKINESQNSINNFLGQIIKSKKN